MTDSKKSSKKYISGNKDKHKKSKRKNSKRKKSKSSKLLNRPNYNVINKIGYLDMKLTPSSYYSTSSLAQARTTSDIIKSFFKSDPKKLTVTECCSNVGGNTVSFATSFGKVNSFELSKQEYVSLVENLNNYNIHNVIPEMNDYTDKMYEIKQDVLYLDPPWGGNSYREHQKLKLFLSDINIVDIVYDLLTKELCKIVVLKAPNNYDIEELRDKMRNTNFVIHEYNFMKGEKMVYKLYLITDKNRTGLPNGSFDEFKKETFS